MLPLGARLIATVVPAKWLECSNKNGRNKKTFKVHLPPNGAHPDMLGKYVVCEPTGTPLVVSDLLFSVLLCEEYLHSRTVFAGTPPEQATDTKTKGRIKAKWQIFSRSRSLQGRMGLVSLRVIRPAVFLPRGAQEHHRTYPTGPLLPPSQSLTIRPPHCTPTPKPLSLLAVGAPLPPPHTYTHTQIQ